MKVHELIAELQKVHNQNQEITVNHNVNTDQGHGVHQQDSAITEIIQGYQQVFIDTEFVKIKANTALDAFESDTGKKMEILKVDLNKIGGSLIALCHMASLSGLGKNQHIAEIMQSPDPSEPGYYETQFVIDSFTMNTKDLNEKWFNGDEGVVYFTELLKRRNQIALKGEENNNG